MSDEAHKEAVIHEWIWKTPAMTRMTAAVLRVALQGREFSSNDLPEDLEHGGQGIAGSVFRWLKKDGVIARVLLNGQPKFAYNEGGNPVGVYQLQSEPLALELLSRHDAQTETEPVAATQAEFL